MIDDVIKYVVDGSITPSINYGVIYNNRVITNSLGYKELEPNKINSDIDTLYDLASLTKVIVTNTLISILKEENLIKDGDLVVKYLPSFKHNNITISQLLTHSSGIKSKIDYRKYNNRDLYISKLMNIDLSSDIDHSYYFDLNYILLGLIIEQIYHKPLDIIAKEKIFDILEMNNTTYKPLSNYASYEQTIDRGLVKGFAHDEKAYLLGPSGHAGLFSNIEDLIKFCQMILDDGIYKGKRFLRKENIDEWFEVKKYDCCRKQEESFSWLIGRGRLCSKCSLNTISHSGFTGTSIVIDRENKLAIVLLSNRIHPSRDNKKFKIYRMFINNIIYEEMVK